MTTNGPRDKLRIKRICEELERLWNRYPDQRLGQLLEPPHYKPFVIPRFKKDGPDEKMEEDCHGNHT